MSEGALPIIVIVLGLTGIVLLGALLVTPKPKHSIINSFLVTTLFRSVFAIIPPIIFEASPDKINNLSAHPMLQAFCTADAIIVRFLTIAMAAFGISFAFPLLYLCCKYSKDPEFTEPGHTVRFYKYSHAAFTFGPFVWALPTVLLSLPKLMGDVSAVKPQFVLAMCKIEDSPSNTLSLALMLSALAFSTVISITLVCYLLRTVKLPLSSHCLGRFDIIQLVNFAILLAVYVFSIISYSVLSATWIRWSDRGRPEGSHSSPIFRISVIWQCITPILYFYIFATHEEVFSIWRSWSRGFHRMPAASQWPNTEQRSLEAGSIPEKGDRQFAWWRSPKLSRNPSTISKQCHLSSSLGQPDSRSAEHTIAAVVPQRILLRPILHRTSTSHSGTKGVSLPDPLALSPPPRPLVNSTRCMSAEEDGSAAQRRIMTMPSLTALGNHDSPSHTPDVVSIDNSYAERESYIQGSRSTLSSWPSTGDTNAEHNDSDSDSWSFG